MTPQIGDLVFNLLFAAVGVFCIITGHRLSRRSSEDDEKAQLRARSGVVAGVAITLYAIYRILF